MISVKNDGPMIKPEVSAHIFEPFYTTKSNGTGLGLAVVAAVAKVHQGDIRLVSNEKETVFTMIIPNMREYLNLLRALKTKSP